MNQELRKDKMKAKKCISNYNKTLASCFLLLDSIAGFTLIELILYMAIVSIVITALVPFAWNVIEGQSKSDTEQEVYDTARLISERLKYEIRNATGINSVSATSISLATNIPSTNPTVINVSNGNISVQQGAAGAINLNSTNATISAMTFTNNTSGDSKTKNIQYIFTVTANYPNGGTRQEFNASTTIESSAEIRSN